MGWYRCDAAYEKYYGRHSNSVSHMHIQNRSLTTDTDAVVLKGCHRIHWIFLFHTHDTTSSRT